MPLQAILVGMYVARVPNRGSPPAVLLRESYREGARVRNRTLANLSGWPQAKVDALARVLKGQQPAAALEEAFEVSRSLPHGHVAAVLGALRELGLEELGVSGCDEDDLYAAMDWLAARQQPVEDALAARHLTGGTLVLYDVSSAAFEGRTCPLGAIGHPKDGVRGRLQIVYGLLASKQGIPVATEVCKGNTGDPKTVAAQVDELKHRFAITKVVLVGVRGMLTTARVREDLGPAGLDWVTALRAPQVKALVRDGALQLSLFDRVGLAEITHPDYPGERLVACMNPLLEAERARIAAATGRARRPLRGKDKIALRVGRVLDRRKVAKHFSIQIGDEHLSYARDPGSIADEAALDGIYVLRSSVGGDLPVGEV